MSSKFAMGGGSDVESEVESGASPAKRSKAPSQAGLSQHSGGMQAGRYFGCFLCGARLVPATSQSWFKMDFCKRTCYLALRAHNRCLTTSEKSASLKMAKQNPEEWMKTVKGFCRDDEGKRDRQAVKESKDGIHKYTEHKNYEDRQVIKGKVKLTKKRFKGWCKVNLGYDSDQASEDFGEQLVEQGTDMEDSDGEPRVDVKRNEEELFVDGRMKATVKQKRQVGDAGGFRRDVGKGRAAKAEAAEEEEQEGLTEEKRSGQNWLRRRRRGLARATPANGSEEENAGAAAKKPRKEECAEAAPKKPQDRGRTLSANGLGQRAKDPLGNRTATFQERLWGNMCTCPSKP